MSEYALLDVIAPDWPAPANVHAWVTTRQGGVSSPPYASLNLATHVGDASEAVATNRSLLCDALALPSAPHWLEQVHGCAVADVKDDHISPVCADAAFSQTRGQVCAVLTADCLPVLLCDMQGTAVAAVHAGWRGLLEGVIEETLKHFTDPSQVLAWLGPAIGPASFEVGLEVRDAFFARDEHAALAFAQGRDTQHWQADLYALARMRLHKVGVHEIYGGGFDTATDPRFYSHRASGGQTGRFASLIWLG
jgi:YfiH family protein